MRTLAALLAVGLTCSAALAQSPTLTPKEGAKHIGERATVCGRVASARYVVGAKGGPTLLNLDEPYPRQIFTLVIWEDDRPKFGEPEKLKDQSVCAMGMIKEFKGKPEIVLRDPTQLKVSAGR
jgi:hypothetical protein